MGDVKSRGCRKLEKVAQEMGAMWFSLYRKRVLGYYSAKEVVKITYGSPGIYQI